MRRLFNHNNKFDANVAIYRNLSKFAISENVFYWYVWVYWLGYPFFDLGEEFIKAKRRKEAKRMFFVYDGDVVCFR